MSWPFMGARLPRYRDTLPPGCLFLDSGTVCVTDWAVPITWSGWAPWAASLPAAAPSGGGYWLNGQVLSYAPPAGTWTVLVTELGPLYATAAAAPAGALWLNGTDVCVQPFAGDGA